MLLKTPPVVQLVKQYIPTKGSNLEKHSLTQQKDNLKTSDLKFKQNINNEHKSSRYNGNAESSRRDIRNQPVKEEQSLNESTVIVPYENEQEPDTLRTSDMDSVIRPNMKSHINLPNTCTSNEELVLLIDGMIRAPSLKKVDHIQRYKFSQIIIKEELNPAVRLFAYLAFAGQNVSSTY